MKGHENKWQERARKEREAMALWGMIMAITVMAAAITAVVVIQ